MSYTGDPYYHRMGFYDDDVYYEWLNKQRQNERATSRASEAIRKELRSGGYDSPFAITESYLTDSKYRHWILYRDEFTTAENETDSRLAYQKMLNLVTIDFPPVPHRYPKPKPSVVNKYRWKSIAIITWLIALLIWLSSFIVP